MYLVSNSFPAQVKNTFRHKPFILPPFPHLLITNNYSPVIVNDDDTTRINRLNINKHTVLIPNNFCKGISRNCVSSNKIRKNRVKRILTITPKRRQKHRCRLIRNKTRTNSPIRLSINSGLQLRNLLIITQVLSPVLHLPRKLTHASVTIRRYTINTIIRNRVCNVCGYCTADINLRHLSNPPNRKQTTRLKSRSTRSKSITRQVNRVNRRHRRRRVRTTYMLKKIISTSSLRSMTKHSNFS